MIIFCDISFGQEPPILEVEEGPIYTGRGQKYTSDHQNIVIDAEGLTLVLNPKFAAMADERIDASRTAPIFLTRSLYHENSSGSYRNYTELNFEQNDLFTDHAIDLLVHLMEGSLFSNPTSLRLIQANPIDEDGKGGAIETLVVSFLRPLVETQNRIFQNREKIEESELERIHFLYSLLMQKSIQLVRQFDLINRRLINVNSENSMLKPRWGPIGIITILKNMYIGLEQFEQDLNLSHRDFPNREKHLLQIKVTKSILRPLLEHHVQHFVVRVFIPSILDNIGEYPNRMSVSLDLKERDSFLSGSLVAMERIALPYHKLIFDLLYSPVPEGSQYLQIVLNALGNIQKTSLRISTWTEFLRYFSLSAARRKSTVTPLLVRHRPDEVHEVASKYVENHDIQVNISGVFIASCAAFLATTSSYYAGQFFPEFKHIVDLLGQNQFLQVGREITPSLVLMASAGGIVIALGELNKAIFNLTAGRMKYRHPKVYKKAMSMWMDYGFGKAAFEQMDQLVKNVLNGGRKPITPAPGREIFFERYQNYNSYRSLICRSVF